MTDYNNEHHVTCDCAKCQHERDSTRKPPKVDDPLAEFPPPSIDRLMKYCYVLIDTDTGELAWGDTYWSGWIYSSWLVAQREIHDTHYKVVRASDLPPESYSRTKDAIKKLRRTFRKKWDEEFDIRKLRSEAHWPTNGREE